MAGLGGTIGAAIGTAIGGTALSSQIGWVAGTLIANYLLAPEGADIKSEGPKLSDLRITASTYGVSIPKVFGSYRIAGNIIWSLPLKETLHEEKEEEGKGGGGTSSTTIWYTYTATFALALCEGPITGINKIWFDSNLVFNNGSYSGGLYANNHTKYLGTDTQPIDWVIQSDKTDTPAYRNVAYIVFRDIELEKYSNRIPNITCEVVKSGEYSIKQLSSILIPSASNGTIQGVEDGYVYSVGGYYDSSYSNVQWKYIKAPIGNEFKYTEINTLWYNTLCNEGELNEYNCSLSTSVGHIPVVPSIGDNFNTSIHIITDPNRLIATLKSDKSCCAQAYVPVVYESDILFTNLNYNMYITSNDIIYIYDLANNRIYSKKRASEQYSVNVRSTQNYAPQNMGQITVYNNNIYFVTVRPSEVEVTVYNTFLVETEHNITSRGVISNEEANNIGITVIDGSYINIFRSTGYDKLSMALNHIEYRSGMPSVKTDYINGDISYYSDNILFKMTNLSYSNAPGTFNSYIERYNINYLSDAKIPLSAVIQYILLDCGININEMDVSAGLTTLVRGYFISRIMQGRGAIEPLLTAYEFTLVEYDFKIVLRKITQLPILNITKEDIVFGDSKLEINVKQDLDLVKKLSIRYANPDFDYQSSVHSALRTDVNATEERYVELAIALTDNEAKQLVEKSLYKDWLMRDTFQFSLRFDMYNILKAGDIITLTYDGHIYDVRLTKVIYTENNIIKYIGVADYADMYVSDATGQNTSTNIAELSDPIGPTDYYILDIPTLDNRYLKSEGLYVGVTGYTDSWTGSMIMSKIASSDSFKTELILLGNPTPLGYALSILGVGRSEAWDRDNFVDVVSSIDLTTYSISDDSMLQASNYILVGEEILQFGSAVDISLLPTDNIYRLSNLLRGRRGTESKIGTHSINERFVYLSENTTIGFIPKAINSSNFYTASSIGDTILSSNIEHTQYLGNNLKPFNVTYLRAEKIVSDIHIKWMRRSRDVSGYFKTLALAEDQELYNISINGIMYTSSSSTFVYTNPMMVNDGFSINDTFTIQINQEGTYKTSDNETIVLQ